MVDDDRIGAQLRRARRARGLTLREVVELAENGLSRGGLSDIERGQRYPSLRTLEILAGALRIRVYIEPDGILVELL